MSYIWDGSSSAPIESFSRPVFSPDDKTVAFVRYSDCGCHDVITTRIEIDAPEGGRRETVYDFADLRRIETHDWSPDGEHILFSSGADDGSVFLATLSVTDQTLQRLVTLDWAHPSRAQYSPDGRFIAYESTKGGDRKIYLINADGAQERVLVDSPGEDDEPLWTRDGRFLLFRTDRSGKWDLHALRMENGQPVGDDVLIKSSLGTESHLRGMTTEGQLYYHELVGGMDVAVMERTDFRAQTAQVTMLPRVLTADNRLPSFAADGQRLAYLAGRSSRDPHINITDLEGKILQEMRLERRFRLGSRPIFSPDGEQMGVVLYDAGKQRLGVVSAETGTLLKLLSPLEQEREGFFWFLGWSRDSRILHVLLKLETGERSLAAIDVETEQVVESSVLSRDVGMAHLSPSKEYLALWSSWVSGQLVLRSLEDGSERRLKVSQVGAFIAWDFDSRHLFYQKSEDNSSLYSFSLDTEEETLLVEDMKDLTLNSVSPDGRHLGFTNQGPWDERVWVLENFLPESTEQVGSR